ncbi:transcriptional regulator FnrL [Roseitranquillus sediminis]|uniref:transcriptional regulator FnrL n=1 Tax=Roseitranquillus sediminis TaxID=2809051 RepID=UPI001D0CCDE7|nr:Crp/Fnr family transcriptional regulator [Roseitranquillus sediminis]MBM9596379.1 Crp/Fnr family transcriptional regulator [Roseitranquillus sediminis]
MTEPFLIRHGRGIAVWRDAGSRGPAQGCDSCPIRRRTVCSLCEPEELRRLEKIKYYRTYEAGQPIMWAGDRIEFVASLVCGVATLSQTMKDGRTQMVGLLFPSDFLGRPGRTLAVFDVVAVAETTLCCFRRRPFEALMRDTPHISQRLLEMALDELDAAREWMILLGRKTAREKIASFVAMTARRQAALDATAPRPGMAVTIPLTRDDMANYLGLTLETVSRQISALKREGIVRLDGNRRIVIPDFDRLIAQTGDDPEDGLPV